MGLQLGNRSTMPSHGGGAGATSIQATPMPARQYEPRVGGRARCDPWNATHALAAQMTRVPGEQPFESHPPSGLHCPARHSRINLSLSYKDNIGGRPRCGKRQWRDILNLTLVDEFRLFCHGAEWHRQNFLPGPAPVSKIYDGMAICKEMHFPRSIIALAMNVMNDDPHAVCRQRQPIATFQSPARVFQSALPMLAHRCR